MTSVPRLDGTQVPVSASSLAARTPESCKGECMSSSGQALRGHAQRPSTPLPMPGAARGVTRSHFGSRQNRTTSEAHANLLLSSQTPVTCGSSELE